MKTLFTKNPKCDETMQHSASNVKINNLWFFSDRAPLKKSLEQWKISKNIVSICLWSNFFSILEHCVTPFFPYFFSLDNYANFNRRDVEEEELPYIFFRHIPSPWGQKYESHQEKCFIIWHSFPSWFSYFNDLCKQRDLGINGNSGPYDVGLVFFFMSAYNW